MSVSHRHTGMIVGFHLLVVITLMFMALAIIISSSPNTQAQEQAQGIGAVENSSESEALTITSLTASFIDNNVSVSWLTNRPATTAFHYRQVLGDAFSVWFVLKDLTASKNHTVVTMLPFGDYQFYVSSTDEGGQNTKDDLAGRYYPLKHTASDPLLILDYRTSKSSVMERQDVTVYWSSNKPASGLMFVDGKLVASRSEGGLHHQATFTANKQFEGLSDEIIIQLMVSDKEMEIWKTISIRVIKSGGTTDSFQIGLPMLLLAFMACGVLMTRGKSKMMDG